MFYVHDALNCLPVFHMLLLHLMQAFPVKQPSVCGQHVPMPYPSVPFPNNPTRLQEILKQQFKTTKQRKEVQDEQ